MAPTPAAGAPPLITRTPWRSAPAAVRRALAVLAALAVALLAGLASAPTAMASGDAVDGDPSGAARAGSSISFGLRPSGAKAVDQRATWTYQKIAPGQVVVDYVGVVNIAATPATFSIYAADGQNTAAGGFTLVPARQSSTDLGTWITLGRKQVTVPARSTVIIPFRMVVPRDAEPGDHAGGIVASFRSYAKDAKGNTVAVDSRVGSRMYVRVNGKLRPHLMIERLSSTFDPGSLLGKGSARTTFTVRNQGNVRLLGHQSVRIRNLIGSSLSGEGVPELPELLPKSSFTFSVRTSGLSLLPISYYTAQVTVDPESVTGNVDPVMQQTIASQGFLGWSATKCAVVLVVACAVGWVLLRRRRAMRPPPDASSLQYAGRATVSRAVGVLGAGLFAISASTGPVGTLTFVPGKGADIDPMYTVLSGPCPAAATHTVGVLTGPGFPAEGINVVPSSRAGMRHDEPFGLPLQNTLKNFAAMSGVTLRGDYTLRLRCVDRLAQNTYATFTGVVTFADPSHFTAPVPAKPPTYGVPVGALSAVFPDLVVATPAAQPVPAPADAVASPGAEAAAGAAPSSPGQEAQAGAPASALPADGAANGQDSAGAVQAAPVSATTTGTSDSSGLWLALALGLAGLVVIAALAVRRRTGATSATSTPSGQSRHQWPDEVT